MMHHRKQNCFILLITLAWAGSVWGCEALTVRDAAFQEPRDVHLLCLLTKTGDEKSGDIQARLENWLAEQNGTLNLELVEVDVEDESVDWTNYGIPGPPPKTPVVVLVGKNQRTRKNFFIDYWEPGPSLEELLRIRTSPFRQSLIPLCLEKVAIVVHSPGTDKTHYPRVEETLAAIQTYWDGREEQGIARLELDRTDIEEKTLLSFLGIPDEGPDWVGVFFGRGKVMDPWIGPDIGESVINGQIEALVGECSCLQTAASLGVDTILGWEDGTDARMIPLREPEMEEEETAMASVRDMHTMGSPLAVLGALALLIIVTGGGVFWWRSQRGIHPLATSRGG